MATELEQLTGVARRFMAFIIERYPFAWRDVMNSLTALQVRDVRETEEAIEAIRPAFGQELKRRFAEKSMIHGVPDPTPRTTASTRLRQAADELLDACDGFFRRAALEASLTAEERREILRGMILTRATDNKLKALFTSGDVRYANAAFQGKGFRSLGQEAIYAAAIRLRRGSEWQLPDGTWSGDVVAPLIRDLGAALAMRCDAATVRMALNAQMAKAGPPLEGKDLNIGDFARGILPPTAPLGIATLTIAGMALAFQREGSGRVAISFIGDGGVSLGEWHEAINLCAVRRLPAIFCVQNNQTALSTPIGDQTAVRVFADKAAGYGIPGITLDGTDPDAIAAAFTWAAERARGGRRTDADRAHRDADVRPRAPRRHAISRPRSASLVGLSRPHRAGVCRPRALRVLGSARSDRHVRGAARSRRVVGRGRRALSSRSRCDGPGRSTGDCGRPLAGRLDGRRWRVRGGTAARSRGGAGSRRSA